MNRVPWFYLCLAAFILALDAIVTFGMAFDALFSKSFALALWKLGSALGELCIAFALINPTDEE